MLEHPITLYPVQESYNIGDTIWIEMNFPDVFTLYYGDAGNGAFLNSVEAKLEDFDFHRNFLTIFELTDFTTNVTGQPKGTWGESFEAILDIGEVVNFVPDGFQYRLSYSSGTYNLKIGHAIKKTGIYLFNPFFMLKYPDSSFGANEQDITPECDKEIFYDIQFPINRQSDGTYLTNYHIFEEYMNPALENNLERIKNRCFTFKVN
jgi:hypothetical protein